MPRTVRRNHKGGTRGAKQSTAYPTSAPSPLDRNRFRLFRAGLSPAEIATREKVTLDAIEKSLLRCQVELQRYSQEEAEAATRRAYLDLLPDSVQAIREATSATLTRTKKVTVSIDDPETGVPLQRNEEVEVTIPDHETRLKGVAAMKQLLVAVQPKAPMVAVDARHQTNNMGMGIPLGAGAATAGLLGAGTPAPPPTSAEDVIRRIRASRGLALTDGAAAPALNLEAKEERDEELEEDEALLAGDGEGESSETPTEYIEDSELDEN